MKELPEGWEWKQLQELVLSNHNYPIGDGDHGQIKPEYYQDRGIPYIRVGDMVDDKISKKDLVFIPFEVHTQNLKSELKPGDVIIAKTGATIGKVAIIPEDISIANTTASIGKITLDRNKMIPKFLLYFLKTNYFKSQMWKVSNKSAQAGFNVKDLKKFKIITPPIKTQKKIVDILKKVEQIRIFYDQADGLIDELLKSVFIDMFGDPIRNEKNWKIVTLGKICTLIKDGPHVSPNYVEKGVPFITVHNIIKGSFDLTDIKYITKEDHEEFSKRCKPEKGDILYTKGGTTGYAKKIDVDYDFSIWVHLALLKFPREKLNASFLESCLNSYYCKAQARKYTRGIANRDLVLNQIAKIKIIYPPFHLQEKFSLIKENIKKNRFELSKSKQEIKILFNTLLQKAFTGELIA